MNSPEVKQFIKAHSALFWYTPEKDKEKITPELLVETILNYGNLDDVKQLFEVLGLQNVAEIFMKAVNGSDRKKGNYQELVLNYFTYFFNKYAPGNP
jgi:hypothetical protein